MRDAELAPSARTSSLKSSASGSSTLPCSLSSMMRSTRLWCVLILLAMEPLVALSITSGYSVPCASSSTLSRRAQEDVDEQIADDLALLLGIGDSLERAEKPLARIDDLDGHADFLKLRRHLFALVLAHQSVIDEEARSFTPALCSSTASTVESTPPQTPQMTSRPADLRRISLDHLVLEIGDAELRQRVHPRA